MDFHPAIMGIASTPAQFAGKGVTYGTEDCSNCITAALELCELCGVFCIELPYKTFDNANLIVLPNCGSMFLKCKMYWIYFCVARKYQSNKNHWMYLYPVLRDSYLLFTYISYTAKIYWGNVQNEMGKIRQIYCDRSNHCCVMIGLPGVQGCWVQWAKLIFQ